MRYFQELVNKSAIVTGGNKGIGKSIALAFAEHGAKVVIVGRDEPSLIQTTKELKVLQPTCSYIIADLQNINSIKEAVDKAVQSMGSLDILVNNAGVNITKPALEVSEEDWDQVL